MYISEFFGITLKYNDFEITTLFTIACLIILLFISALLSLIKFNKTSNNMIG